MASRVEQISRIQFFFPGSLTLYVALRCQGGGQVMLVFSKFILNCQVLLLAVWIRHYNCLSQNQTQPNKNKTKETPQISMNSHFKKVESYVQIFVTVD